MEGSFNNMLWSIFTYGSTLLTLIVFLSLPFREEDTRKIFWFSLFLTLFECGLGYYQMLAAQSFRSLNPFAVLGPAAGDNFVGTTFDVGIGNLVAIKMSLTALLFIPFWFADRSIRNSALLLLLMMGWILPSAIYTLLFGLLVVFFFFIAQGLVRAALTLKIPSTIFYATVTGVLLLVIFFYTQRNNVEYTIESLKQVYSTARNEDVTQSSRKIIYIKEIFTKLPEDYPYFPMIGVGPGNYSSRSAWLVSGEYLEHQPDYIPVTPSEPARKYMIPLWSRKLITEEYKGGGSITNQPFSTWFSLFTELGIAAVILLCLIMLALYKSFDYAERKLNEPFYANLAIGLKMTILYLGLIFFVDNLIEWPIVMAQFFVFAALIVRRVESTMNSK